MAATDKRGGGGGGGGTGLSWDAFEEQAKLAFVSDAARTRLTLKTRVGANKKVAVVARVVSQPPRKAAQEQASGGGGDGVRSVKYQTNETGHLFRLTRLLRFAMQEVLGPMRATEAKPAAAASTPAPAPAPTAGGDAKPKKKKKSKGKKKH